MIKNINFIDCKVLYNPESKKFMMVMGICLTASSICMVIKSTGALFESIYCENKDSNKNLGYGTLYQEGAITLAAEYGRSYIDILKAYYNNTINQRCIQMGFCYALLIIYKESIFRKNGKFLLIFFLFK